MGAPLQVDLGILGWSDSLILMVLALVVFGPRRLPQIGRQIGKLMYEFRKASNEFKFQMEEELRSAEEADRRKKEEERLKALALKAPAAEAPADPAAASANSPYREDAVYPSSAPPAEPQSPATVELQPEETYPRIQPPATGEQVPAARPADRAAEFEFSAQLSNANGAATGPERDAAAAVEAAPENETVPAQGEDLNPVTEQAAQHG